MSKYISLFAMLRRIWASSVRPPGPKLICMKQKEYLCLYATPLRNFQELAIFCEATFETVKCWVSVREWGSAGCNLYIALNCQHTFHCGEQNNITFHHEDAHYVL